MEGMRREVERAGALIDEEPVAAGGDIVTPRCPIELVALPMAINYKAAKVFLSQSLHEHQKGQRNREIPRRFCIISAKSAWAA